MMNESYKKNYLKERFIIYTSVEATILYFSFVKCNKVEVQSKHKLWLVQIVLMRSWHVEHLRGGVGGEQGNC